MTRGGMWTVLGVITVTGVASWIASPEPREIVATAKDAEPWQVPKPARATTPAAVEALAKSPLWGNVAAATASTPLNDPDWRFLGIIKQGADRIVLIKVDGQPEQRLTINDKLPGGSEILDIGDDSLCILINGQKRRLAIYKTGTQIL